MVTIDLGPIARQLNLPPESVQRTVELLDEGNTVPFITRYRKDQTGGLDEQQLRSIADLITKERLLAERKLTVLKSIQSQGRLTDELEQQITRAVSGKVLEDLYLPFKPKKQTLATAARQRGLEPLAQELLSADPACADLEQRAEAFVDPDKQLAAVADVLLGVGHLLAERFSERAELRGKLRKIYRKTGKLISTRIEPPTRKSSEPPPPANVEPAADETQPQPAASEPVANETPLAVADAPPPEPPANEQPAAPSVAESPKPGDPADSATSGSSTEPVANAPVVEETPPEQPEPPAPSAESDATASADATPDSEPSSNESSSDEPTTATPNDEAKASQPSPEPPVETAATPAAAPPEAAKPPKPAPKVNTRQQQAARKKQEKREAKQRKREKIEASFKQYFNYEESIARMPPHRVLAINRGERARVLRVKIDVDQAAILREAENLVVPAEHPHGDFLRGCVRDAVTRLVLPSLDRELRRELTDKAEQHAVEVFVRNLRKLLLQQPIHGRRVLALDPGYRSGCKLAALDEFGNVLGHGMLHLVGRAERVRQGRARIVEMIRMHRLSVVAIGNGAACREAEHLISDVLSSELKDRAIGYVIANEAGASVYSTSAIGREEFPNYDATLRSAVSIGRRVQDPLSELVKINPANIGVGLYQHDVKAKHLRESLDAVVESCVNFVGVDVNTASPALLRYVSGLNQLTARRIYEHRRQHGPFRNREQLRQVSGLGEATFVQAAGFLKIADGDNPLDATWIHPESYDVAHRVLQRIDVSDEQLAAARQRPATTPLPAPPPAPKPEPTPPAETSEGAAENAVPNDAASAPATDVLPPAPVDGVESPPVEAVPVEEAAPPADDTPAVEDVVAEPTEPPPLEAEGKLPSPEATTVGESPPADGAPIETTEAQPAVEQPADAAEAPAVEPAAAEESGKQAAEAAAALGKKLAEVDVDQLAGELGSGKLLLADILAALARPGRDPRDDLPPPLFHREVRKLDDLQPGMRLTGAVLNVVDFGAFVDIGISDSGLVHISRLADRYVSDPHDVVSVGDVLDVWVVEVDRKRRRVSLTAIQPGTEKPPAERRPKPPRAKPAEGRRRPPRSDKRKPQERGRGGRRGKRDDKRPPPRKARPPKPLPPITKGMIEGTEAMRTFGDLLQFVQKKDEPDKSDGADKS